MAVLYPCNKDAANLKFTRGNFGLWFNKYIPVIGHKESFCKACDASGDENAAVTFYYNNYKNIKLAIEGELTRRHELQTQFLQRMKEQYEVIELRAKLISPLLTGAGYPHASETSLLFDHNLGIPYIPSSSVKGIVRFALTIGILDDKVYSHETYYIKDASEKKFLREEKTPVGTIFGYSVENIGKGANTQEKKITAQRGSVIFLDAYPERVPDVAIDILNPHYPDYYSKSQFPSDNQNPLPIKFLAVAQDTVFIFRAIVKKHDDELLQLVLKAFRNALCVEGVGAKTAIGYGRFTIQEKTKTDSSVSKREEEKQAPVVEIVEGNEYEVKVIGVTADRGAVQVLMPDGKKAIIGKKDFPKEVQNNLKQYCKSGPKIRVKVVSIQSGNVNLKLV